MSSENALMKKKVGFARFSPEERIEIARRGARKLHTLGKAHQWNHKTGQAAGRKGGLVVQAKLRAQKQKDPSEAG